MPVFHLYRTKKKENSGCKNIGINICYKIYYKILKQIYLDFLVVENASDVLKPYK